MSFFHFLLFFWVRHFCKHTFLFNKGFPSLTLRFGWGSPQPREKQLLALYLETIHDIMNSRGESGWCSDVTSTHGAWRHAGVRFFRCAFEQRSSWSRAVLFALQVVWPTGPRPWSTRPVGPQGHGPQGPNGDTLPPVCHETPARGKVTLAGLEPAIFGSEDQRLIH